MAHTPPLRTRAYQRRGFSLIELSVVVAIMAIVAVAGLEGAASLLTRSAYSSTQEKLATLDAALVQFFRANGRLPCPAVYTTAPTTITYGFEDCSIAVLTGTGTLPGGGVLAGAIPFRALNLPMDAAMDGYGSKLFYYVTKNLTTAGVATGQFGFKPTIASATISSASGNSPGVRVVLSLALSVTTGSTVIIDGGSNAGSYTVTPFSALPTNTYDLDPLTSVYSSPAPGGTFQPITMTAVEAATAGMGGIEIRTGTLAQPCNTTCQAIAAPTTDFTTSTGAAYAIVSAGADRRGAVSRLGVASKNCVPTTSDDQKIDAQNCAWRGSLTQPISPAGIPLNVLYDSRFNTGTVETNYFDDLIVWRLREQL